MWKSCRLNPGFLGTVLILSALSMGAASAKQIIELKGARFPVQQIAESCTFSLQGAGILKWGIWFDIYAAAYYVDEINPQNRKLVIHYFVPVQAQQIKSAAEKHLLKQNGTEFLASIKPSLDRLHAAMDDVAEGDTYAINLYREQVLVLERNGLEILRLAEPELGMAYLNLWLGNDPLDEGLKLSLLGPDANP